MPDRVVKVTLLAQVGQYVSELTRAQQATQKTGTETDKLAAKKQSLETLAKGAVVFGGAITAVGLAALKTGIQYNTLQQTTRAALTTLLGSAKAANDQMDKLDAFAKKSPFAKQVFITAQQQLLGFGVAADKVLPTLQAIQDTVAAFGGSNEQIAAIADILARIQSQGRLSGDALERLGYYGVDAAKIIGDQMGKTSAEIKDMASKPGGIPVTEIWDPLVTGMETKFGGAAANVKKTFAGATDRMKAAWRDFSSDLAEPLVGKNGGGALVDLLNWTADAMRAFIALPDPIKLAASAGVGLIGVVSLLGGTAILALPKIVAFRVAIQTLRDTSPLASKALGGLNTTMKVGTGIFAGAAAAAVGLDLLTKAIQNLGPSLDEVLNRVKTAKDGVSQFTSGVANVSKRDLTIASASIAELGNALDIAAGKAGKGSLVTANAYKQVKQISQAYADMASSDLPSAVEAFNQLSKAAGLNDAQQKQLIKEMGPFRTELVRRASDMDKGSDAATLLAIATGKIVPATKDVATAQDVAAKSAAGYSAALDGVSDGTEDAAKAQGKWIQAVAESDGAFIDLKGAYDGLVQKNKDVAQSTADATKSSKDSWKDYYDGAKVSIANYLKELEKQVKAQENWESNMLKLAGKVSAGTLTELAKMGPDGAPLVAQLVNASGDELAKMDTLFQQKAGAATGAFATTLDQAQPVIQAAAAQLGKKGAEKVIAELAKGSLSVEDVIKKYNLKLEQQKLFIWADTSHASSAVNTFIKRQSGRTINIRVQANGITTIASNLSRMVATSRATGGILPGAPSRTDNMLIAAASGEFVVNSAQTARHRNTLEAINSGQFPGYAGGGFVQPVYAQNTPRISSTVSLPPGAFDGLSMDGARFELVLDDGTPLRGYVQRQAAGVVSAAKSGNRGGRR